MNGYAQNGALSFQYCDVKCEIISVKILALDLTFQLCIFLIFFNVYDIAL